MNKTKIEWVKNPDGTPGYTSNPITGCLNHTPEGLCLGGMFPCYAYKLANGRLKSRYLANRNVPPIDTREPLTLQQAGELQSRLEDPFYPRFWEDRYAELVPRIAGRKYGQRGIFLNDMSDWLGIGIPREWTQKMITLMELYPEYRFYTLTKQYQNLPAFSPFPDNCWVGVTATDSTMFGAAYYHLKDIRATIKYISIEPLLDWDNRVTLAMINQAKEAGVGWIITGSQTKPYRPPKIEQVEEIVRACDKAGIPVFLKNNLKPLLDTLDITSTSFGRLTSLDEGINRQGCRKREWYQLRQEMPDGQ